MTLEHAEDALQRRALLYDRKADRHYDTISAWIKATRGSDPDASLYYLAVMLEGGEDPRFIVRRMVVLASEDIGNADPQALVVATAAASAVEPVGLPECQFALAQAAVYLSLAPKSDAAKRAVFAARQHIRERGADLPPAYLRSSTRSDGGYDNPHRRPGHLSPQELLPDEAIGDRFYEPDEAEQLLRERLAEIRARGRAQLLPCSKWFQPPLLGAHTFARCHGDGLRVRLRLARPSDAAAIAALLADRARSSVSSPGALRSAPALRRVRHRFGRRHRARSSGSGRSKLGAPEAMLIVDPDRADPP